MYRQTVEPVCRRGDNEKLADHIVRAKEMKPSVLFLSYGMNDVGAQNGDADGFIKAYRPVIRDLKKITAGYENIC